MTLVRKQIVPTERPPLAGEASAIFCGWRCRVVSATDYHCRIVNKYNNNNNTNNNVSKTIPVTGRGDL
jgi:hypothetical protein